MQLILLMILICGVGLAHGDVRFVSPGMSIQTAVNNSVDGDTVILEDGIHTAMVMLNGRDLTIASRYLLDNDTNHIPLTVVMADTSFPDVASCFVYVNGETPASRLVGLTMEGGRGTRNEEYLDMQFGGAIYLKSAASYIGLSVEHCDIRLCRAFQGGGIYARGYNDFAQITLLDCHFYGCFANDIGGGVLLEACSLEMQRCVFEACSAYTSPWVGMGVIAALMGNSVTVDSCQFLACASGVMPSMYILNAYGPGSISGCLFDANIILFESGMAADLFVDNSAISITGCHFNNNTSGFASTVLVGQQPYVFAGNVIENGVGSIVNGSLYLAHRHGDVAYNLVRNNTNIAGGAILSIQGSSAPIHTRVHHNVFTGNVSLDPARPSVLLTNGMVPRWDSNWITGNAGPTIGNHPQAAAATIDARNNYWGHSSGPYHPMLNPGGQGDTLLSDSVLFIPWMTEPPDTTMPPDYLTVREQPEILSTWELMQVYPNPFNQSVTLVFVGFSGSDFEMGLYNLLGQQVDVVHRGPLTGGQLHYQAPAWLASGVYLLSARDGRSVQTRKVVLLK